MTKYTSKRDVAAAIDPIFDLADDAAACFSPRLPGVSAQTLFEIRHTSLRLGDVAPLKGHLSAHRQIELRRTFSADETHIMRPLGALIAHLPPINNKHLELHLKVTSQAYGHQFKVAIKWSDVLICEAATRAEAIHALYIFIRTHENLDMGSELEPYRLDTFLYHGRDYPHIWADNPQNALLRFAACSTDLQKRLRAGETIKCERVNEAEAHDLDEVLAALKGRTRKAPAEPKDWAL